MNQEQTENWLMEIFIKLALNHAKDKPWNEVVFRYEELCNELIDQVS